VNPKHGGKGAPPDDPLWYRDAVIYELHVKSFFDSYDDGVGDFRGLTQKLDYLQELGVTALWLLPFYPSPLKDDGYDIALYTDVHPSYGTLDEFREFLREAHRRGLKVITELVINHTSDQHPWFQRARNAPAGSPEREFYVWSDDPTRYSEARIIFKDFEPSNWTWDPVARQYFWHRFFHHQPDLNFENPRVHEELFKVMDFWFEMGVDGMRLDAIPYLYEREGTTCDNLPETHAFLRELRAHVDRKWANRMLLAEANLWPEDAARYFGSGDECHMCFHFPIMPRLFMAVRMEDRFPVVDILDQTPAIPDTAQWAIFLRNHDELTLEMVTDEERDYMYRAYAHDPTSRIHAGIRRRLAPLLENNRRKIELMNSLLLSLPGTPVLYYGDEIGMGDNVHLGDRNGVRTPMQWSGDRNAGFSRANPQRLFLPIVIDPEYHFEAINVETQHGNPSSLLWWTRRLLALRRHHQAFGRGDFHWVDNANPRVVVFTRCYRDETILVVGNLSRYAQAVELDLAKYQGRTPVELFGRSPFPVIGEAPYLLTLGPHNFYWFRLDPVGVVGTDGDARTYAPTRPEDLSLIELDGAWESLLEPIRSGRLERQVIAWLRTRPWFGGGAHEIRAVTLGTPVPVPVEGGQSAQVLVIEVAYVAHDPEHYLVPLMFVAAPHVPALHALHPGGSIVRVRSADGEGMICDATAVPAFGRALLELIAGEQRRGGEATQLRGIRNAATLDLDEHLDARPTIEDHASAFVVYGDRYILKLLRRLHEGTNLDREIGFALTRGGFDWTPDVLGAIEVSWGPRRAATVGVLQSFVPNQGNAWELTRASLMRYYERALAADERDPGPFPPPSLVEGAGGPIPDEVHAAIGDAYLETARLLGRRTAELHLALAKVDEPDFRPDPFTSHYQRSLYQALRNLVGRTFRSLPTTSAGFDPEVVARASEARQRKADVMARLLPVFARKLAGQRIRTHGDLQLRNLLFTGSDFVVTDFEGDATRPLSERRLPRSPLRDVASMLRSFRYAAARALVATREQHQPSPSETAALGRWTSFWQRWVSVAFLQAYFDAIGSAPLIPNLPHERQLLLDVFLLEKAVHELGNELANRPVDPGVLAEAILYLLETLGQTE
jgi:maltose alpha-D-glucosyltransferase/alpha-amylase